MFSDRTTGEHYLCLIGQAEVWGLFFRIRGPPDPSGDEFGALPDDPSGTPPRGGPEGGGPGGGGPPPLSKAFFVLGGGGGSGFCGHYSPFETPGFLRAAFVFRSTQSEHFFPEISLFSGPPPGGAPKSGFLGIFRKSGIFRNSDLRRSGPEFQKSGPK